MLCYFVFERHRLLQILLHVFGTDFYASMSATAVAIGLMFRVVCLSVRTSQSREHGITGSSGGDFHTSDTDIHLDTWMD